MPVGGHDLQDVHVSKGLLHESCCKPFLVFGSGFLQDPAGKPVLVRHAKESAPAKPTGASDSLLYDACSRADLLAGVLGAT